jgi:hypothetical protein
MPRRCRSLAAPLAVALLLVPAAALAEPAPSAETSAADALFTEGRALLDAGRFTEAIAKFTESEKLDPGVGTMLNLAYCYEKIGKTATAWSSYRAAAAAARDEGDAERQTFAEERAASLEGGLSHLTVRAAPTGEPDDLAITVDGAVLPRSAWALASAVDPGRHEIHAAAAGHRTWDAAVDVEAGVTSTVTVPVLDMEPPPSPPESPRASTSRGPRWQDPAAVTAGSAGVVSLGISLAFTLAAKSRYDSSSSHCSANNGCDAMGLAARRTADTDADVATGTVIAGGALVAGGLALWLLAPRDRPQRSGIVLLPALGPTSAGLTLHRVW